MFFHFLSRKIWLKYAFLLFGRLLHCVVTSRGLFDRWSYPTGLSHVTLSFYFFLRRGLVTTLDRSGEILAFTLFYVALYI